MCGIYASVSKNGPIHPTTTLKQLLVMRGPDHLGESESTLTTTDISTRVLFMSTVLALRGSLVTAQPLVDISTQSVLCWNGEAWKIGQSVVQGNDGEVILNLLVLSTLQCSRVNSVSRVLEALQSISGPYAFVYLDKVHDLFYFGRDHLGQQSLLYNTNCGGIQISSVADDLAGAWKEIEVHGTYVLSLSGELTHPALSQFSFEGSQEHNFSMYHSVRPSYDTIGKLNMSFPFETYNLDAQSSAVNDIELHLNESLKPRVLDIPYPPKHHLMGSTKLAILFSGGLDCTILARMAHDLVPVADQIDLLNVAFENPRVIQAAKSILPKKGQRDSTSKSPEHLNTHMLTGLEYGMNSDQAGQDLETSIYESCPDRITGRKALKELRAICPGRTWRFVEINIPYSEAISHRSKLVALMFPHNTEMDLSIGYALYFAARGSGVISADENLPPTAYQTPARVLLSGFGADELFAGYTRHATAFERRGFPGLLAELELDVNRLGKRNLGRDDRVISNWGREARYPYLDEALVKWALETPVWSKCGFSTTEIDTSGPQTILEPGKKVLRLLAERLGMFSVAREKKRAIQFGARTAKMEKGRTKGTSQIST